MVTLEQAIQFIELREGDFSLLYDWFQEPIVKKWYAHHQSFSMADIIKKYQPRIFGTEKVFGYIIQMDGIPIGFIQYYCLQNYFPEGITPISNALFSLRDPEAMAGIDLFIAVESFRKKGFGAKIIEKFISSHFIQDTFSIIVVDPAINNSTAIRCYQRCGFMMTPYSETPEYLIMIKHVVKNIIGAFR